MATSEQQAFHRVFVKCDEELVHCKDDFFVFTLTVHSYINILQQ